MTLLRALLVTLLCLSAATPAAAAEPIRHPTSSDLIQTIGLDNIFARFGQSIAVSPRQHGIADPRFLGAWEAAALQAFADSKLNARLESSLAYTLSDTELAGIDSFLTSPFGRRVTAIEQEGQNVAADRQVAVLAKGRTLYWSISEHRKAQFEELLSLSSAEMTFSTIAESLRGMALGLHLSRGGDVEPPWEEIDASVRLRLSGIRESLAEAAHAALAYTYNALTDAELEDYLSFLRTPAARKFYDTAALTVGEIIRETMFGLGEEVALRLRRVDI